MTEQIDAKQIYKESCRHCRHNPSAVKPYAKMKKLPLNELTTKLVEKHAEKYGLSPDCWICLSATSMLNMPIDELIAQLKKAHAKN